MERFSFDKIKERNYLTERFYYIKFKEFKATFYGKTQFCMDKEAKLSYKMSLLHKV